MFLAIPFVLAGVFILGYASSKASVGDMVKCAAKKTMQAGESLKSTVSSVSEDIEDAKAEVADEKKPA
jgi:hypothetical protein